MEANSNTGVAKVKFYQSNGKTKHRSVDVFSNKHISLEYAPDVIVAEERKYLLKVPVRCLFEKEADYYVIQNEVLGIIGTGLSEEIAVQAFAEEFDHLYQVLNGLNDVSLTAHNKQIKGFINYYVEKIE